MTIPKQTTTRAEPVFLAAVDGAVLGTALVYEKHRTGVHRVLEELLQEFRKRPEVRVEFLSSGRAAWLELPTRIAFDRDWARQGWVYRARGARIPGTYPLLLAAARLLLKGRKCGWLSEHALACGLQILGSGLRSALASFTAPVYWSPAHALPTTPPGVARCLTLYDMIPAKFPQWYNEARSFHAILNSIDTARDTVITISECTRRDWRDYSGAPEHLSRSILIGVSDLFRPLTPHAPERAHVRAKYGIGDAPFLLAVGTLEPRKNLETLVRAFITLRNDEQFRELLLVLVGPKGWKNDSLFGLLQAHPEIAKDVRLTGFVPDEDLPGLYAACETFIYPSRYEGFGLPVAEALKCGAAVVCGDNSSLPEVAGDAAAYADIEYPAVLATVIRSLLDDAAQCEALRLKARERGKHFEWADAAEAYIQTFSSSARAS